MTMMFISALLFVLVGISLMALSLHKFKGTNSLMAWVLGVACAIVGAVQLFGVAVYGLFK